MAVAQRLDRGLDDEIRGAKVRLADAQIDDVAALRDQSIGAGQHREGVFLADAVESRDRLQHGVTPRTSLILPDFGGSSPDRKGKIKSGPANPPLCPLNSP